MVALRNVVVFLKATRHEDSCWGVVEVNVIIIDNSGRWWIAAQGGLTYYSRGVEI